MFSFLLFTLVCPVLGHIDLVVNICIARKALKPILEYLEGLVA